MSAVNETLIRDVVSEVLGRLNRGTAQFSPAPSSVPARKENCGCDGKSNGHTSGGSIRTSGGQYGVFQDANQACAAAHDAYEQLRLKGVAARGKVVEIIKTM